MNHVTKDKQQVREIWRLKKGLRIIEAEARVRSYHIYSTGYPVGHHKEKWVGSD